MQIQRERQTDRQTDGERQREREIGRDEKEYWIILFSFVSIHKFIFMVLFVCENKK